LPRPSGRGLQKEKASREEKPNDLFEDTENAREKSLPITERFFMNTVSNHG
jgi:hypothetical protein